jgi:hypothetical protein
MFASLEEAMLLALVVYVLPDVAILSLLVLLLLPAAVTENLEPLD